MNDTHLPFPSSAGAEREISVGAAPPLIVTKIRVPRRRTDVLPRPRLTDFLHAHLDRRVILLSAPAGYGKTTLLTDFAHDTDLPVCWYTLDPFDRDLRIFLEYLIAAIAQRFPAFGQRSRAFLRDVTDLGGNLYPLVATIVQEMYDAIPEYFVLVLDDHHAVEDQEQINQFIDLLVTYVDENFHLILASRTLPALPNLSLLVARRQATGLSIDELRFTAEEIQALARQNYGLKLGLEQAKQLMQRTDGWVTGLLLTAVPHWQKAQSDVPVFGRVNVDLYDYFSAQVLNQQPALLRDFLLASSVLDEVSPELCSSVLGIDNPARLMDEVRARNLFVIEFEGHQNRLRYHDLFREFLQATLQRCDWLRFQHLTRRAAETYARRGEWERAVGRYLTLEEYQPVVEIVERTATALFETGRWDTLAGWIDALPPTIVETRPRILLYRGKIHLERGEHGDALTLYEQSEEAFAAAGAMGEAAHALAMKGYVLGFQGRYAQAIAYSQKALGLVTGSTDEETLSKALAHRNQGFCQLRMGQLEEGRRSLGQALLFYEDLDDPYDEGLVHQDLGLSYELAGDLTGAMEHYQAALLRWQRLGNLAPWANTLNSLGVIHHLRGEYEEAKTCLSEALSKVQQVSNFRVEAFVWASLGDVHRDLGTYEQARQAYTAGLHAATRAGSGFTIVYTQDGLGNIARLEGHRREARNRLQRALEYAESHGGTYEIGLCCASLGVLEAEEGNLVTAAGHLVTAAGHLDRAIELFRAGGLRQELARAHLRRAQVAYLDGDEQDALADMEECLSVVEELGFDQFLVVEGVQFHSLLQFCLERGLRRSRLSDLLRRVDVHGAQLAVKPEPVIVAEPQLSLQIYALGQPRVELGGQNVQWATVQSRNLFFSLLQHPQGLRKEEIGQIFWPDHPPLKLDGIFRSSLYRLRRALFRESVIFEEGIYRFNWDSNYSYDAQAFDRLLDQAAQAGSLSRQREAALLRDAASLYQGDYLEDVYDEWCMLERERLRGRYLSALESLAGLYVAQRDLQQAIDVCQRLLAEDPYREATHRELMHCYFRLGDRVAAIRQYQTCAGVLREELGLSPAPETEDLYLQIIG
jgi:LuxR family maltose regulon positive regulatory protein